MLTLKLLLVPCFLLVISSAGKRWGPSIAGWLAGLPVVAGPILFFLALERGAAFASNAAAASLSAVFASVSFSLAYAHAAQRLHWAPSLLAGLGAWGAAAWALSCLPTGLSLSCGVALLTLWGAPRLFPSPRVEWTPAASASTAIATDTVAATTTSANTTTGHVVMRVELCSRMVAGAVLTVAVTVASGALGPRWSGLLAVFSVLGLVLAVFSHRSEGPAFVAALLRAMARGLVSFAAFCGVLSWALPRTGLAAAFGIATVAALAAQALSMGRLIFR